MIPSNISCYSLRPAILDDAYAIWQIMDTCAQFLEHKEYFICDNLDYVKDILSGHGFAVVACDTDGNIIGNLLVKYPGLTEENLGYDVFSEKEREDNLMHVVHMDSSSIHPNHRGHGLESQMITYAETLIDTSKYCYSLATVAPDNLASLRSLQRIGYQVMVTKKKYGGLMRNIMMKVLT